jgi:hypothetical protein
MQDQPAPSRDGATAFTLREAAAELGISLNTLRRRISAGQIDAERVHRPQGHVWQVYLHRAATQEHRSNVTVQQDGATVQQPASVPPAAEAMVSLIQTTIGTILGPLVAEQSALRQTVERQAERVAELERENGRLSADLEHAATTVEELREDLDAVHAQNSTLVARGAPETVQPTTGALLRRWRLLWPLWAFMAIVTVLVVVVAVVVRLVVPR